MAPPTLPPSGVDYDDNPKLVTVLVTGFSPFQTAYPVNPSYEIAKSLPQLLPRSAEDSQSARVIAYESPIRVCYQDAKELLPRVLESYAGIVDIVLHIGMASGRDYYTLERYAHRDGYIRHKDLNGKTLTVDEGQKSFGECPERMTTSLRFDDILTKWQESVRTIAAGSAAHGADVRPSDDAGHFLCDYSYFNSLAWYGRRSKCLEGGHSEDRPVLFLHVPAESDPDTLEKGRAVTTLLIRAIVDSYVATTKGVDA